MNHQNRPGPLNEHDYYSTREHTESQQNESSQQEVHVDGLQVDNSSTVLNKIAKLYADKLMNDVCLVVGGKDYLAHRLILCASSEVFHVMLMNPNWTESHNKRITLQEPSQCCNVFGDFLAYLYTGRIQISHATVMPVMALADKYNVLDLMSLCKNFMIENIPSASRCNQLMNWLQYSFACGHQQLANACRDYVRWNFQSVAAQDDFGTCEVDVLISIIQMDDLAIYDEMTVFHCLVKWIEAQEDPNENLVRQVFSYVRFPMMTPRQLADLLLCSLTQRYKEFFVERMAIAMAFHSGQKEHFTEALLQQNSPDSQLFTPRLYTSEKWGTHITLENFPSLQPYHTRTLLLSSPTSCADFETDAYEWVIEFSPKGVWFRPCCLIVWQGNIEIPETVLRTVRLSVMLKEPNEAHVRVAVLVYGVHGGVEHVRSTTVRNFIFSPEEPVLRYENLLPYSDINPDRFDCGQTQPNSPPSPFLVGPKRDTLKVQLIILPQRPYRRRER
ncbi:BTB/POZ domain-containing protein 17 [Daphnia magna]|uniref:Uncharacterized protein n=2 Tax=Daphnia magna TaxID=35525 RepID=A0ABQ9Z5P9_9CRUS|nr:BTB/POZ domain-containing protein 17 [Daphnia magna]KAK4008195.1 hypothetical protein OUZ56_013347 [Daphnia magna]KZS21085.1 BTB/POZ and BACK domain-containing protein [Daphnia magna]